MQFKHPEILYFLFLLVIPILVHLFQLRRFKKEFFTNVKILKELSVQTRKSSKLKKWLLLASRLLLLGFLVLAFAQPFFVAKDKKNASNELYVILDNSYSMQAKGQKGELLKRAVEDLLEHTPEGKNISLLTISENFWNTDIKSIQKELQNLKYSATSFNLENLINQIKAKKSAFNKDIVVITDAVGLEAKQLKSIDNELNTLFVIPKSEQKGNVSLDSVFINQTLDDFYEIGLKLTSHGAAIKETSISLFNNDTLIAKTIAPLDSKNKFMNFTIPKEDFNGYFSITDNGLAYDNQLYFSISKPEKKNVISIGLTDKSNFLSRIYTSEEFEYKNYPLENLEYNKIELQDAIIVNELKEIPRALQTTLKSFVDKGGNLVVIPAEDCNVSNLSTFIENVSGIGLGVLTKSEKLITKIHFDNPLYQSVFEKKIDNFQYPNTKASFAIKNTNPAILSYQDQNIFLTSKDNLVSSVYVFAAPINTLNSNFQKSPLIVPTFYNMAQNAQKTGIISIVIGNNNPFLIETNLGKDEILEIRNISKNTNNKFIPEQQIVNTKAKLTFNDYPKEAGNFGVFNQEKKIKNISFNYSRTESSIYQTNENSLGAYKIVDSVETVFNTLKFDRSDTEIWKWFLYLTLLFFILEILIQKFVK